MKKFVFKILLFSVVFLIIFSLLGFGMRYVKCLTLFSNAKEVYDSIFKSKNRKKVRILIIGDSVCGQLYPLSEYNSDIYSIACSQSTTLAGQYFLLNNFVQNNLDNLPEVVILMYTPFSFQNNLDKFSYNYLLKPFYNNEYLDFFDNELKNVIVDIPFHHFSKLDFVRFSNFSPIFSSNTSTSELLSPISERYLGRIVHLCKTHNIKFHLESTPVNEKYIDTVNELNVNDSLMYCYKKSIKFYSSSLFVDKVHFDARYIPHDILKLKTIINQR